MHNINWESCGDWMQAPRLLKVGAPLIDERNAFEILVRGSADYLAHRRDVKLSFNVGLGQRVADLQKLLPNATDGGLSAYALRVSQELLDEDFSLALLGASYYDVALFDATRNFIRPLLAKTGMPQGMVDVDIFFGKYRVTPIGIHRDNATNFSFVISGNKRYVFWPPSAISTPSNSHVLGRTDWQHYPSSIEISAVPGDVVFWPADYWHLAVSDATDTAATVNIAIYRAETTAQWLSEVLPPPLLNTPIPSGLNPILSPNIPEDTQAGVSAILCGVEQLKAQLDGSAQRAIERWLKRLSADAIEHVPPPKPESRLNLSSRIRLCHPERTYTASFGDSAFVAANGHVLRTPNNATINDLLSRLRSHTTVQELCESAGGQVHSFLQVLDCMRALEVA